MAVEQIGNCVRRIVRIKVPFRYVRVCIGHDSTGNDSRTRFGGLMDWHVRLGRSLYVCCGSY